MSTSWDLNFTRSHAPEYELSHFLQRNFFSSVCVYYILYLILYIRNSNLTMFTSNGLLLFALVWSLNHLLQYVICNLAWWKMVSPLYDFWSGFIDCLLDQTICSTGYNERVTLVSILICLLIETIFIQCPRWGTLTGKLYVWLGETYSPVKCVIIIYYQVRILSLYILLIIGNIKQQGKEIWLHMYAGGR